MSTPSRIPYPSEIFPGEFEYLTDPVKLTPYQAEDATRRKVLLNQVSQTVTEANILRAWADDRDTPLPAGRIEFHVIRYCALLFDFKSRKNRNFFVPDPWFQENAWCIFKSLKDNRAGSCFFGSQNQGKSDFFCFAAVAFGVLHPHSTNQSMVAPLKADKTVAIWTRFLEIAKRTARFSPEKLLALGAVIDSRDSSGDVFFSEDRPGGFIRLQGADQCGNLQGTKEREDGFLIHYLDEIGNNYPNGGAAWLGVLPNISSNNRYFCLLSANPRNQIGQLDSEMEPAEGWSSQTENDYFWKAGQHNINVYRRAGWQSPNFRPEVGGTPMDEAVARIDPGDKQRGLHGPFPWLYNGRREGKLLDTVSGNTNDPRYKEQAMGMMPAMSLVLRVLTPELIKASGMDLPFLWTSGPKDRERNARLQRVAFLDPAKTADGDRCVLTLLEVGWRLEADRPHPNVFLAEQTELIPTGRKVIDMEWLRLCRHVRRRDEGNGTEGHPVSFERELAILAARQCLEWQVPFANFGFDDSLSGPVTQAMVWAFGDDCTSLSFGGKATRTPIKPHKKIGEGSERRLETYADLHQKFVTELYSRMQHWLRGGYIRMNQMPENSGAGKPDRWIAEGMRRLCTRHDERRWDVESKKEYKARKNQISPDYCDSFVGALYLVDRKGLLPMESESGKGDENDRFTRLRKNRIKTLTMAPSYE